MSRSYRIVTVTPAGRKKYLEILVPYLLKNRKYIDEHHFWLNTTNKEDIEYINSLEIQYPDFFRINRKEMFDPVGWVCIWQYFKDYTDENTVYLRFDDDICYMGDDAVPRLIECRLNNPNPFLVYGNVINNTFCSYIHQKQGAIPKRWYEIKNNWDVHVTDSGRLAAMIHMRFLSDLKTGRLDKWKFVDFYDANCQVNVISWFGRDLKNVRELSIDDLRNTYVEVKGELMHAHYEEFMLSTILPKKFDRPNLICGDAIFCHFAFTNQRGYLENMTNLLNEYRNIEKISLPGLVLRSFFAKYNRKNARLKLQSWAGTLHGFNLDKYPSYRCILGEKTFPRIYGFLVGMMMSRVNMPTISLQSTVAAGKDHIVHNLQGETVILSLKNGVYYTLNPTGVRIWNLIQEPIQVHEIHDSILSECDVEARRCEEELLDILQDMAMEGLIKVET